MLDLVLWSCLLALTPWALGLARMLISGVAGLIGPAAPTDRSPSPGPACPGDLSRHAIGRNSHTIHDLDRDVGSILAAVGAACRDRPRIARAGDSRWARVLSSSNNGAKPHDRRMNECARDGVYPRAFGSRDPAADAPGGHPAADHRAPPAGRGDRPRHAGPRPGLRCRRCLDARRRVGRRIRIGRRDRSQPGGHRCRQGTGSDGRAPTRRLSRRSRSRPSPTPSPSMR